MADPLKILHVEDHVLFRAGFKAVIEREGIGTVVLGVSDVRQALAAAQSVSYDVAVVDMTLPNGDGIELARELIRIKPDVPILMLTMHTSDFFVRRAFAAGVLGYSIKTQGPEEIMNAILTVARGDRYIAPRFADSLGDDWKARGPSIDPLDVLTERERKICRLILKGLSNKAIADSLAIRPSTVSSHRSRAYMKLGVHSIGELIRLLAL